MATILVTGGAGFIGSHCVDVLLRDGHQVVVFDKKTPQEAVNLQHCLAEITYVSADLADFAALEQAMSQCDHVIHLAAFVSVPESIKHQVISHHDNVTGTLHVFEAMKNCGVTKGVYASSAAVYGMPDTGVLSEASALQPLSPYGVHKRVNEYYAEQYREQHGMQATGLRFFNVYGERQDPSSSYSGVISIFLDRAHREQPVTIYGTGEATRDFVYVGDVAEACVASLFLPQAPAVMNVGTGVATSLNELVATIGRLRGVTLEIEYQEARTGDIQHSCADVTLLTESLSGLSPTALDEGLRRLVS